jgi:alkylated DNA repair dioxygenase AlkB
MFSEDVIFMPDWLPKGRADALLAELTNNQEGLSWEQLQENAAFLPLPGFFNAVAWEQKQVFVYGKWHLTPRLTAWQAAPGIRYRYSGQTHEAAPMAPAIRALADQLAADFEVPFNSVLLNWYRSGQDAMGWHADDEPELGPEPVIASVSLGATRRFVLKHKTDKRQKAHFDLTHGSLLLMKGRLQHDWLHALPRTAKVSTGRINLTFRQVFKP